MRKFYTKLLCGLVLGASFVAGASAQEKAVVVISTDGSMRQEVLTNVDRIEIGATSLTLKSAGGESETVDYKDLDRVLIGAEWSEVKQITSENEIAVWPTLTTDVVNISGLNAGEAIEVVALNGANALKAVAADGLTTLNLRSLPAGVYIVNVKKHSVKIIKK